MRGKVSTEPRRHQSRIHRFSFPAISTVPHNDTDITVRSRGSRHGLDDHGRAVANHFRGALNYLGGIVAHTDDSVASDAFRVLAHEIERLLTGSFTQLGQQRDIAAEKRLHAGAEDADNRAGPDSYPANDAKRPGDATSVELEGSSRQVQAHGVPRSE
jgi:hypothetical protein